MSGEVIESLNIIFPVYNEEKRLESGVVATIDYLDHAHVNDYRLTIVDNGSQDATEAIAHRLCEAYPQVHYVFIGEKGVGAAFRKGVELNRSPIVGYMDIDLSTKLDHLDEMLEAFSKNESVGMVNASRWSRLSDTSGRKWYRNISSHGLTALLKLGVNMQASDSICGFKFFRKDVVERLVSEADRTENGWFYIIELLLRAERSDWDVYELPVHWEDDSENSKVEVFALVRNYCAHIVRLRRAFKKEG